MPGDPPGSVKCRDPFDVPFLQLAIVVKSNYLVTGMTTAGLCASRAPSGRGESRRQPTPAESTLLSMPT
jgi:hypothetical protein